MSGERWMAEECGQKSEMNRWGDVDWRQGYCRCSSFPRTALCRGGSRGGISCVYGYVCGTGDALTDETGQEIYS